MSARVVEHAPHVRLDGKDEPIIHREGRRLLLTVGGVLVAESSTPGGGRALSRWAFDNHGASRLRHAYDLATDEVERSPR